MPMHKLHRVRIIDYVYRYGNALLHAKQRAGRGSVIAYGADDAIRHKFECDGRDVDREISFALGR